MTGKGQDSTRGIGRAMILTGWVVALVLLSLGFHRWFEQQHNPNEVVNSHLTADGSAEVVLLRNRRGHYVASGKVNGYPAAFLLDTGASDISVPGDLAQRWGLKRGLPRQYQTANGLITTFTTQLERVELGDIVLDKVRAHINPHLGNHEILLGMSFLKHLELIQRGDTLTLRQHRRPASL